MTKLCQCACSKCPLLARLQTGHVCATQSGHAIALSTTLSSIPAQTSIRRCLKSSTFTPCTFVSLYCAPDVFNRMEVIASFFLYRLLCVSSQVSAFSSARCRAGKTDRESCHWTIFNNMHHRLLWCTTVTTSWICDLLPAGKACCTSALTSSETIQCAPQATR